MTLFFIGVAIGVSVSFGFALLFSATRPVPPPDQAEWTIESTPDSSRAWIGKIKVKP